MPSDYTLLTQNSDAGDPESSYERPSKKRGLFSPTRVFALIIAGALIFFAFRSRSSALREDEECSKEAYKPNDLPQYYTLPSGDKIPAVALGVWQAGKNEAGRAVKVGSLGYLKVLRYDLRLFRLPFAMGIGMWTTPGFTV